MRCPSRRTDGLNPAGGRILAPHFQVALRDGVPRLFSGNSTCAASTCRSIGNVLGLYIVLGHPRTRAQRLASPQWRGWGLGCVCVGVGVLVFQGMIEIIHVWQNEGGGRQRERRLQRFISNNPQRRGCSRLFLDA